MTLRMDSSTPRVDIDKQTLLGSDQSGNVSKDFNVHMTVNGFLNIQKFKSRKNMNLMIYSNRQGIRELSEFEALRRSGVMR